VLPHHGGPRAPKARDSSTSLRRLVVNPLGNVLRFGYHSATGTSAWAAASVRRKGSRGPGLGTFLPSRPGEDARFWFRGHAVPRGDRVLGESVGRVLRSGQAEESPQCMFEPTSRLPHPAFPRNEAQHIASGRHQPVHSPGVRHSGSRGPDSRVPFAESPVSRPGDRITGRAVWLW